MSNKIVKLFEDVGMADIRQFKREYEKLNEIKQWAINQLHVGHGEVVTVDEQMIREKVTNTAIKYSFSKYAYTVMSFRFNNDKWEALIERINNGHAAWVPVSWLHKSYALAEPVKKII